MSSFPVWANTAAGKRDSINATNMPLLFFFSSSWNNARPFASLTTFYLFLSRQIILFPDCGHTIIVAQYCISLLDKTHSIAEDKKCAK